MRPLVAVAGVVLAGTLIAACADGEPTTDPEPSGATGLTEPRAGHLTRLAGDGTHRAAGSAGPAAETPLLEPAGLAVGPGRVLLGFQSRGAGNQLFRLDGRGMLTPVPDLASTDSHAAPAGDWILGTASTDDRLVVVHRDEVEYVDVVSGDRIAGTGLPHPDDAVWTAGVLPPLGRDDAVAVLQYAGRWYAVGGTDTPTVVPVDPLVPDAIAAAATGDGGAVVVTDDEIVTLDSAGAVVDARSYRLPDDVATRLAGTTITGAAADADGTVYLAHGIPPRGESGTVVAIGTDGTAEVVAHGARGSDDCRADSDALDADLALPSSLLVWDDRLVIADAGCDSVWQLPLM